MIRLKLWSRFTEVSMSISEAVVKALTDEGLTIACAETIPRTVQLGAPGQKEIMDRSVLAALELTGAICPAGRNEAAHIQKKEGGSL